MRRGGGRGGDGCRLMGEKGGREGGREGGEGGGESPFCEGDHVTTLPSLPPFLPLFLSCCCCCCCITAGDELHTRRWRKNDIHWDREGWGEGGRMCEGDQKPTVASLLLLLLLLL